MKKDYQTDATFKTIHTNLTNDIRSMNREELMMKVYFLQEDLKNKLNSKVGRKSQVLALLREHGRISIMDIANELGISTKNVSSQLTYLRTDGYEIFTDSKGLKMLVE